MTLAPSCPTAAWSVPPSIAAGLPLLGISKDRPSIGEVGESTPGSTLPHHLRDEATSLILVPLLWFLTTSAAFSSSTLRACCIPLPILGFTAFPPVAKRTSSRCLPALRSFVPRRQRRFRAFREVSLACAPIRGAASPSALFRAGAFTACPCPPDLPLPGRRDGYPPRLKPRNRASRALLHRRVRNLRRRFQRCRPDAPMGLSDDSCRVPSFAFALAGPVAPSCRPYRSRGVGSASGRARIISRNVKDHYE